MTLEEAMMIDPLGQVYTFFDSKEGQIDVHASLLGFFARRMKAPIVTIPVEARYAIEVKKNRGLEEHRLKRLTVEICDANPLLFIEQTNGHMLIDGNHRYYRLWELGRTCANAWIAPETAWRPFQITDMPRMDPETMLTSFSGVL